MLRLTDEVSEFRATLATLVILANLEHAFCACWQYSRKLMVLKFGELRPLHSLRMVIDSSAASARRFAATVADLDPCL